MLLLLAAWSSADERPRLVAQLGHYKAVTSIVFSPDGAQILTGSLDESALPAADLRMTPSKSGWT